MTAVLDAPTVDLIDVLRAALAVTCPKCKARPAHECESTGGGNRAYVPTHKARERRVSGWPEEFAAEAGRLVKSVLRATWEDRAAVDFSRFEQAAAPVPAAKPLTPKGVRLSETQAEEIERYVLRGGYGTVSTAHFHGDAAHRQTVNALEAKGIVEEIAGTKDGYGRDMKLTEFGWQVYDQHRLIIKRLTDEQVAELRDRADQPDSTPEPEPICAHCGQVQQGLAVIDGQLLCHTDDQDCWTRVTVLRHQMPCGECADGGEGGSR